MPSNHACDDPADAGKVDYNGSMASTPPELLTDDLIETHLADLHPDWTMVEQRLHRSIRLPDFASAFGCMAEIAIHAERLNHHPEWSNVYSRIEIDLTTHDSGGLTRLDFELASAVDTAVERRRAGD